METVPRESYSRGRGTLGRGVRAKNAAWDFRWQLGLT